MHRRDVLLLSTLAAGSCWAPRSAAEIESAVLERHDLLLQGDRRIARRALLLLPKRRAATQPLSLLVLLHGLGETGNEALGIKAWAELYGLIRCYERLVSPPITRTLERQAYLTDETLAYINASLEERPFRKLAIVCPVTPNPHRLRPAARTLDTYTDWIQRELLPAVQQRANVAPGRANLGLDGCSLGGYVALEVFLRKPELFGSFGMVQSALGEASAGRYALALARAIDRVGPCPIHIETSSEDPYRRSNEALSRALKKLGVPNRLEVLPGPHDQPWLREAGTLAMLFWHAKLLGSHVS